MGIRKSAKCCGVGLEPHTDLIRQWQVPISHFGDQQQTRGIFDRTLSMPPHLQDAASHHRLPVFPYAISCLWQYASTYTIVVT